MKGSTVILLSCLALAAGVASQQQGDVVIPRTCTLEEQWNDHPLLCHSLERMQNGEAETVAQEIQQTAEASGWLVDFRSSAPPTMATKAERRRRLRQTNNQQKPPLPIVLAHGMGDSCFNPGIQHILKTIGEDWLGGVFTICIPTGKTQAEDTNNGFFLVSVCWPTL